MVRSNIAREFADERLGVWIFGARGGIATTLMVGARAIARGLARPQGLLTETPLLHGVPLVPLAQLVFGGHEVRRGSLPASAQEIHESTGTIPLPVLQQVAPELAEIDTRIRRGCLVNAGPTIEHLADADFPRPGRLRDEVARISADITEFLAQHSLRHCVCVNLASTEPKLALAEPHEQLAAFERALDANDTAAVRPSAVYAWVAASLGLPFIHFTPSNATLVPAVRQMFDAQGVPYMGCDGKTGETLVKSSLAPMFKYRDLKVLSWQGYNLLGDRDGAVLADEDNKQAKIESKDSLLASILGYPLHTHVGIDYVPSLSDLKTAWDFIHFQGFLGYKMSLQFTWQGCDAILAAPIVLDMIRFAEIALRRREAGPMRHLSCFFKRPLDVDEHDLHRQWHLLTDYVRSCRSAAGGA